MIYTNMATVPSTLEKYSLLTNEQRQLLVKTDPETLAPYLELDGLNFELVVQ